jgi:hypothetical protein
MENSCRGLSCEQAWRVMKRGRLISFAAKEKKVVNVFPTVITARGNTPAKYSIPKFPYEISIER